MEERRLALDLIDFAKLIAGQEVARDGVRLILSDVGFGFMREALDEAEAQSLRVGGSDG